MTERQLKYSCGLLLVTSHLALIFFVIWLYFKNGFSIDEFTTVLAVITPMFAGYTTSILAVVIAERRLLKDKTPKVTVVYMALSFIFPVIFVGMLFVAVFLKARNEVFPDFETFKRFLLILESIFAAYVGMFVYSMFEKMAPVGVVTIQVPPK
jgi:hypothetical protein